MGKTNGTTRGSRSSNPRGLNTSSSVDIRKIPGDMLGIYQQSFKMGEFEVFNDMLNDAEKKIQALANEAEKQKKNGYFREDEVHYVSEVNNVLSSVRSKQQELERMADEASGKATTAYYKRGERNNYSESYMDAWEKGMEMVRRERENVRSGRDKINALFSKYRNRFNTL